jgi:hypothetical protein
LRRARRCARSRAPTTLAFRHDRARVEARVGPVVDHVVARLHRRRDSGHAVELAQVARQVGKVGDALAVAAEKREIRDIETHQRRKQAPVGLGRPGADEIRLLGEDQLQLVERLEHRVVGRVVGGLGLGKAAAVYTVIDLRIDEIVDAVDLGSQRFGIIVCVVARDAAELAVQHANDLGGLVIDDALRLLVPERGYGDLAGVVPVGGRVRLMQVLELIHRVGRAVGKARVLGIRPAFIAPAGKRERHGERVLQPFQREEDQHPVSPRAAVREIEVIAARLGLESGRPVGADAVAKAAFDALELAARRDLLRQVLLSPASFDQYTHASFPKKAKTGTDTLFVAP